MTMLNLHTPIKQFLKPVPSQRFCRAEDRVRQLAGKVYSSHQLMLVGTEQSCQGVVSGDWIWYKSRKKPETKAKNCLIKPPHLLPSDPTLRALELMRQQKWYELVVFELPKSWSVAGLIDLFDITHWLMTDKEMVDLMAGYLTIDPPLTIDEDQSINQAYKLMRQHHFARLLLTNKQGKLSGIVTRSDMQFYLSLPVDKQRFYKAESGESKLNFEQDELKLGQQPVKRIARNFVFSTRANSSPVEIFRQLADSEYTSLVLVSDDYRPQGIIAWHSILEVIYQMIQDSQKLLS